MVMVVVKKGWILLETAFARVVEVVERVTLTVFIRINVCVRGENVFIRINVCIRGEGECIERMCYTCHHRDYASIFDLLFFHPFLHRDNNHHVRVDIVVDCRRYSKKTTTKKKTTKKKKKKKKSSADKVVSQHLQKLICDHPEADAEAVTSFPDILYPNELSCLHPYTCHYNILPYLHMLGMKW